MFKVVPWDYTGKSAQWAKNFLKSDVEIIRTLRPDDPDKVEAIMLGEWNFVLIFENGQRELFDKILRTMRVMNRSADNIIFANDFDSWVKHPAAVYALLKPEACDQFYRHWNFFNHKRWHYYHTASAEGLHYVGTAADNAIMWTTYTRSTSQASDELKLFRDLSKRFYGVDDSGGVCSWNWVQTSARREFISSKRLRRILSGSPSNPTPKTSNSCASTQSSTTWRTRRLSLTAGSATNSMS